MIVETQRLTSTPSVGFLAAADSEWRWSDGVILEIGKLTGGWI